MLADQGAMLAVAPVIGARGKGLDEHLGNSAKRSPGKELLQPQIMKKSKIMVELRANDQAAIEPAVMERRTSGDGEAAVATTLYGGLFKEGTTSPASQRGPAQASPRGLGGGARRGSSIEERNRYGK